MICACGGGWAATAAVCADASSTQKTPNAPPTTNALSSVPMSFASGTGRNRAQQPCAHEASIRIEASLANRALTGNDDFEAAAERNAHARAHHISRGLIWNEVCARHLTGTEPVRQKLPLHHREHVERMNQALTQCQPRRREQI